MDKLIFRLETIIFCHVNVILTSTGFILSIICLAIFRNPKFNGNFYNYMRVNILFGGLCLFSYGMRPFYYCKENGIHLKYSSNVIHMTNRFLRNVFDMTSIQCCLASSVYLYLILINLEKSRFNILARVSYRKICLILFIFSIITFTFRLFEYKIVEKYDNFTLSTNQTVYKLIGYESIKDSSMSIKLLFKINRIGSFLIADGILVFLLLFMNILIFVKVKQQIRAKRYIQRNKPSQKTRSSIRKANKSIIILVFVNSLNMIIGKFPLFIYYVLDTILDPINFKFLINFLSYFVFTVFTISYDVNFILFYFINKTFRLIVNETARKVLNYLKF
jgi:hypothetical protein